MRDSETSPIFCVTILLISKLRAFELDTLLCSNRAPLQLDHKNDQTCIFRCGSKYAKIITYTVLHLPGWCTSYMANSPRLLGCWSDTESLGLQIHTQWAWVALHRGPGPGEWLEWLEWLEWGIGLEEFDHIRPYHPRPRIRKSYSTSKL